MKRLDDRACGRSRRRVGRFRVVPRPAAGAGLVGGAGAGIERVPVDREEADAGVAVEDLLGPVAVVDVPVDDEDAVEPAVARRPRRRRRRRSRRGRSPSPRPASRGGPEAGRRRRRPAGGRRGPRRPPRSPGPRRSRAAVNEPGPTQVSGSIRPPPAASNRREPLRGRPARGPGAVRRRSPRGRCPSAGPRSGEVRSRCRRTVASRSGCSGWPAGGAWSSIRRSVKRRTMAIGGDPRGVGRPIVRVASRRFD